VPDILKNLGLDVYALTDADTNEARTFTTYSGYWAALAEHIDTDFGGPPFDALLTELEGRGLRKLSSKPASCSDDELRSVLLNAWSSELALYDVDLDNAERLWLANQWAQVKSYYATSRAGTAWLLARNGNAPENHTKLLRAISADITGMQLYPSPWALCCTGRYPDPSYDGFPSKPGWISNLAADADRHDRTAMILRTTREREVERLVDVAKKKERRKKARTGEQQRQDDALVATTVFDFTWRMRTRSNYGDPAMFYVGTLSADRARDYAVSLRTFTSATMFLFEAMVSEKARKLVTETAVHFTSRDRAKIADQVLVPRLKALGLI
jgi:hypothetical protein